jgi:hypothetical protein
MTAATKSTKKLFFQWHQEVCRLLG